MGKKEKQQSKHHLHHCYFVVCEMCDGVGSGDGGILAVGLFYFLVADAFDNRNRANDIPGKNEGFDTRCLQ